MKSSSKSRRQVFLDLYSGAGGISKKLKHDGFGVLEFEINRGEEFDLTRPCVRRLILSWLRSGIVRGVWLATICKSWSRARRGPPGSNWQRIRNNEHIYGLPGLPENCRHTLKIGNATMRQTAEVIKTCIQFRVPVCLENPVGSMLWQAPPISKLLAQAQIVNFDQCAFGAGWRKRTKIAGWNAGALTQFENHDCSGHKGICSFSKKPHIHLSGSGPNGKMWTALAQEYPPHMCAAAGRTLSRAADEIHLLSMRQKASGVKL